MHVLVLSLVSAPFPVGMGLLIWGCWRLSHIRAESSETRDREASLSFLILSPPCVLAGGFFPATLEAAKVPFALQIGMVVGLSFLLFIPGEWYLRSAVIYRHEVTPGAPWLAFLGIWSPAIYLAVWTRMPHLLLYLYTACLFIVLPLGRYLLMKRWRHAGGKLLRTLEDR